MFRCAPYSHQEEEPSETDYSSAQLTFHLTTVMRSPIVSVSSPSHPVESSEAGVRVDGGCYVTKTRHAGRLADLDRDIVVFVETEDPGRPQV